MKMFGAFLTAYLIGSSSFAQAEEKVEINDAFKKCLIVITLTGKDQGQQLEIKAKRKTSRPLTVIINKGSTNIANHAIIMLENAAEISLLNSDEGIVTLPQTSRQRVTSGSVTLEANCK